MSKICLIRPPRVIPKSSFSTGTAIPPIGLAYLVSSLEQASFDVSPIDAIGERIEQFYQISDHTDVVIQGMRIEEIVARIPAEVALIGVSCMFSCEWFLYEILVKAIRLAFPGVPLVLGGEHVTAEAANILNLCPAVDFCVSGEGEETLVELARALARNESVSNIPGLSLRMSGQVVKNPPRERIKDINSLPNPSWKSFPVASYHKMGYGMASMNRRSMPILASRGCPFRCTFCSNAQMWGTELYLRSPRSVVDEIRSYKQKYDIEHVDFVDIVGVLNRKWVIELLTLMIREDLGITWLHGAGTRSEILDDEVLKLFKESNVLRVFYAPESGSKETLRRIKKRVDLDKINRSIRQAHKLGISMRAPLIYGFPGQTLKEAFQNLFFSFKLSFIGVDDVVAHAFSAYPGTELFHQLVSSGEIDLKNMMETDEYSSFLKNQITTKIRNFRSWSAHIPSWSLPMFQYGGMSLSYLILFVFHPKKLFQSIRRVFILRKPLTLFDHVFYSALFGRRVKLSD